MREIKFRAWDLKHNRWANLGDMEMEWRSGDPAEFYPVAEWMNDFNLNVMQFTGIKDIHDVEIYEGDILTDNEGDILVVKYIECMWHAKLIKRNTSRWPAQYLHCQYMGWVVLGNIYENPELLEPDTNR